MGAGRSVAMELIRLAYEGVLRKQAWEEMLALACRLFRAKDAYFARAPAQGSGPRLLVTHGVDPKVAEVYRDAWIVPPRNPILDRLREEHFHGVVEPKDVMPRSQLERTEFFDVCRRPRQVDEELGCGDVAGGGEIRFISVNRAKGDPPFRDRDWKLMAVLYPHLMQALEYDAVLAAERSRSAWLGRALEDIDDPVLRRDPDGRLHPLNSAGEAFLRDERTAAWEGDAILPRTPRPSAQDDPLSRAVGFTGTERSFRGGHTYRVFSSPHFEDGRFVGEIIRLRRSLKVSATASALEPQHLTPHESRVAGLICHGQTSQEVCFQLGISLNTLNTHLRHLYEKTGCHTRAQLVVHLGLAAWSRAAEGEPMRRRANRG